MTNQLLNYIISLFGDDATRTMANKTGESHANVKNALESIIPTIMRGFASKSAEGPEAVSHILNTAKDATDSGWWQQISNFFTQSDSLDKGKEILRDLFGGHDNMDRIANKIATNNNIKPSSATTLMQMAAPVCLGALGKTIGEGNINAGTLAGWFATQKLDLDTHTSSGKTPSLNSASSRPSTIKEEKGKSYIVPLLIALLIIAALAWYLLKSCNDKNDTPVANGSGDSTAVIERAAPKPTLDADSTVIYNYSDVITLALPDNTTLSVPGNSAEAVLYAKIQDAIKNGLDTSQEGKTSGWINLYDVQFSKGLTYRKGAKEQLHNIAMMLKAYPQIHLKLGGYTDATGSAEVNAKMSQQRAEMVTKELADLGVANQIDKAEGYGPAFPIADNATAEGRAQNRRVSCRITAITTQSESK